MRKCSALVAEGTARSRTAECPFQSRMVLEGREAKQTPVLSMGLPHASAEHPLVRARKRSAGGKYPSL